MERGVLSGEGGANVVSCSRA